MGTIALMALSLAPIIALLWYFDHLDKNKESRKLLFKIFMWGVLATFIAAFAEVFLEETFIQYLQIFELRIIIVAFVFTALVEEGLKYWVVKKKAYKKKDFNEYYDGIIYGVVASLGFAALENVFYVLDGGIEVGILRALLAVPAHAVFGALMGYYISLAKFSKNKEDEKKFLRKGLWVAVFFHGLYDFLLMSETLYALLVFPLIIWLFIDVHKKIKRIKKLNEAHI